METYDEELLSDLVRKLEVDRGEARRLTGYYSKAFYEMYDAVNALISGVKKRHPGEALQCPDMIRLEELIEKYNPNNGV